MKILLHNLLKKLKKCVYYIDIGPHEFDCVDFGFENMWKKEN